MTGDEILAANSNDPFRRFIRDLTLGLSATAGTAGLLGLPGTNAAAAGGNIGGSGSIIGGQFVPTGGFVSDAALAGLPGAGGAAGTVSSGLGGSAGFLGGGGLTTSGTGAAAINADILAGGSGSIGGGAVGSPSAGGSGAFGLTQDFATPAGSSILDQIKKGASVLEIIDGLGGQEIGAAPGAPGSTGIGGGSNPLLFPGQVREVGTGPRIEDLIGRGETRDESLQTEDNVQQDPGVFGKFFGNLDQNLESPSKLLGLGLLSSIDPRLAQAGLLAGGIFGKNKLF